MAAFRNMSLLLEKENSGDCDDENYSDNDEVNEVEEVNEAEETEGAGECTEKEEKSGKKIEMG